MKTRWTSACEAVTAGLTSPAEIRRVFGFSQRGLEAESEATECQMQKTDT